MTDALQCDRCGEFETGVPQVPELRVNIVGFCNSRKTHLCSDCQDEFKEWWRASESVDEAAEVDA